MSTQDTNNGRVCPPCDCMTANQEVIRSLFAKRKTEYVLDPCETSLRPDSGELEFLTALEDLWKCVRKNLTDTGPPSTSCPSLYLNGPKMLISTDSTSEYLLFGKFFLDVTELLVKYRSRNITLLADLLDFAAYMSGQYGHDMSVWHNEIYILMLRILLSSAGKFGSNALEYIPIERVGSTKTSFIRKHLSLPYNMAHSNVEYDIDTNRIMLSGKYRLLKEFLKFGVASLRPVDSELEKSYTSSVFSSLFELHNQDNIRENMLEKFNSDSRRRLFLLRGTIEVLKNIRSNPKHTDKYVRCMELFFKSIPDPIVSVDEIKSSFQKLFDGMVPDKDILSMCQEVGLLFPDSLKPPQPRSLKHLSRIQIRENLRTHECCLPVEVNSMLLPEVIQDYILLEEDKFELTPEMLSFEPLDTINHTDIGFFSVLSYVW